MYNLAVFKQLTFTVQKNTNCYIIAREKEITLDIMEEEFENVMEEFENVMEEELENTDPSIARIVDIHAYFMHL